MASEIKLNHSNFIWKDNTTLVNGKDYSALGLTNNTAYSVFSANDDVSVKKDILDEIAEICANNGFPYFGGRDEIIIEQQYVNSLLNDYGKSKGSVITLVSPLSEEQSFSDFGERNEVLGNKNSDGRVLGVDSEIDNEKDIHNYTDNLDNEDIERTPVQTNSKREPKEKHIYSGDGYDDSFKEEAEELDSLTDFDEEEFDEKAAKKEAAKEKRLKRQKADQKRRAEESKRYEEQKRRENERRLEEKRRSENKAEEDRLRELQSKKELESKQQQKKENIERNAANETSIHNTEGSIDNVEARQDNPSGGSVMPQKDGLSDTSTSDVVSDTGEKHYDNKDGRVLGPESTLDNTPDAHDYAEKTSTQEQEKVSVASSEKENATVSSNNSVTDYSSSQKVETYSYDESNAKESSNSSSSVKKNNVSETSPSGITQGEASSVSKTQVSGYSQNGSTSPLSSSSTTTTIASGAAIYENSTYNKNAEAIAYKKSQQMNQMLLDEKEEKEKLNNENSVKQDNKVKSPANIRNTEHGFQTSTDNHTSRLTNFDNYRGTMGVHLVSQLAYSARNKITSQATDPLGKIMLSTATGIGTSMLSMHFKNAALAMSKDFKESVSLINKELGVADTSYSWKKGYKNALKLSEKNNGENFYKNFTLNDLKKESGMIDKQIDDLVNSIKKYQKELSEAADNAKRELIQKKLADLNEQLARKRSDLAITKTIATGRQIKRNKKASRINVITNPVKNAFYMTTFSDEYFSTIFNPVRKTNYAIRNIERVVNFKYNVNLYRASLTNHSREKLNRKATKFQKKKKKRNDRLATKIDKLNSKTWKKETINSKILKRKRRITKLEEKRNRFSTAAFQKKLKSNKILAGLQKSKLGKVFEAVRAFWAAVKGVILKLLGYLAAAYLIILGLLLMIMFFLNIVNYEPHVESPLDTEIGVAWKATKEYEAKWLSGQTKAIRNINLDDEEKIDGHGELSKNKWGFHDENFVEYMGLEDDIVRDQACFKFIKKPGGYHDGDRLWGNMYFKKANSGYDDEIIHPGGSYAYAGRKGNEDGEKSPENGCYPVTIDVYSFNLEFVKEATDAAALDNAITKKNGRLSNIKEILAMCLTFYDNASAVEETQTSSGIAGAFQSAVNFFNNIKEMVTNFLKSVIGWFIDKIEAAFDIDIPEGLIVEPKVSCVYTAFSLACYYISHESFLVHTAHDEETPDIRYCGIAARETHDSPKIWKGHLQSGHDTIDLDVEETDEGSSGTLSTVTEEFVSSDKFAEEEKPTRENCNDYLEFTYHFGEAADIWEGLEPVYGEGRENWGEYWCDLEDGLCTCDENDKEQWREDMRNGYINSWEDTDCPGHTYQFCPGHLICKVCVHVNTFLSTNSKTLYQVVDESNLDDIATGVVSTLVRAGGMIHFNYLCPFNIGNTPVAAKGTNWMSDEMHKKVTFNYKEDWNDTMFSQFEAYGYNLKYFIGHSIEGQDHTAIPLRMESVNKFLTKPYDGKELSKERTTIIEIASRASGNIPYSYGGSSSQIDFHDTNYFPDGLDCSGFACWVYSNAGLALVGPPGTRSSCAGILSHNPYHALSYGDPSLKPGDLVIKNAAAGGATTSSNHVKIFVGWNLDGTAVTIECGGNSASLSTPEWTDGGANGIYDKMLANLTGDDNATFEDKLYKLKKHKSYCILNEHDDIIGRGYKFAVTPTCLEEGDIKARPYPYTVSNP